MSIFQHCVVDVCDMQIDIITQKKISYIIIYNYVKLYKII